MSLKWNGDALAAKIEREMGKRLDAAAIVLQRAIQKNIDTSNRKAGYSKPGNMPNKGKGELNQKIFQARDGLTAVVGVPKGKGVVYGRHLETGFLYSATKHLMAVPVSKEAMIWSQQGKSPRDMPFLVRIIRPGHAPVLVEKTSKRQKEKGAWIIHYVLLRNAWVAPRHFLNPTLNQCLPQIKSIMGAPL